MKKGETKNYNGASSDDDICGKRIAPWEIRVLPGLMNKKADMVSVSPFYFFFLPYMPYKCENGNHG